MTQEEIDQYAIKAWDLRLLDLQASYKMGVEILSASESKNYKLGIADSSKILAYCYWRFSDYSLSLSYSISAIEIYQKLGNKKGEADTLNNIGAVYMFQGNNEKRLEVNLKCQEIRREIGDLTGVASSEGNIGETYFEMGDYINARACFENCIKDEHVAPQGLSWAYHNLGRIEKVENKWESALEYFQIGLEMSEAVNYSVLIVDSYLRIVELYIDEKMLGDALINAEKALNVSRDIGAKEGEKSSLYFLSKIYEEQGLFESSLKYHKEYHVIELEISRDTEIERLKTTRLKVMYDRIEIQKNELVASIKYAESIQNALMLRDEGEELFTDYFVLYQPKDIVSGDFYWFYEKGDYFYMAVADCTGHGVPGALLSMLGTTFLNEIIALNDDPTPAFMLDRLRQRFIKALSQSIDQESSRDGMDISLLRFNTSTKEAEWAGAYNPLWIVRNNDADKLETSALYTKTIREGLSLYEIKGNRFPIGFMSTIKPFSNHKVKLLPEDTVYMFSDGFSDQFGGSKGKKYRSVKLKETFLELDNVPIEKRGIQLEKIFNSWKGHVEQLDDVCVFGIKILALRDK